MVVDVLLPRRMSINKLTSGIIIISCCLLSLFLFNFTRAPNQSRANQLTANANSRKSFVFHALHKTGSAFTRTELIRFCRDNMLVCLSYCACSEEYCYYHLPMRQVYKICDCTRKISQFSRDEIDLVCGSYSPFRLTHGCCPNYEKMKHRMTGLIDHFSLEPKENREFIDENFKGAFRFTLVREPLIQFISYHHMSWEDSPGIFPNIHKFIDICYNFTNGIQTEERFTYMCSYLMNSQSRELGWNKNPKDHKIVLEYVESLNFVGLTECLHDSWRLLREKLDWPEEYFKPRDKKPRSSSVLDTLSEESKRKLKHIQSADIELYEFTRKLFLQRYGQCNE